MSQVFLWAFGLIGGLYLITQLAQLYYLFRYKSQLASEPEEWPKISIWVAARDEEATIERCITSLLSMNYPKSKIQILVGNDQSKDRTREIVEQLASVNSQIKLVDIEDRNDGLKAKARVMAQLDIHADADYYLITDADVWVNPDWAKTMLRSLWKKADSSNGGTDKIIGVCSGTTLVKSPNTWGWLQEIDWSYFMGLLNIISYAGVPATAVGNNMIISKEAYWSTGGYSKIQFSITEDYKLYSEVCNRGYGWSNVMHPGVVAYSAETKGFIPLLHQRKRWLSGGKELPWYWWVLFGIFGGYHLLVPVVISVVLIYPVSEMSTIGVSLWIFLKWIFQSLQIKRIYKNINASSPPICKLIAYEPFIQLITFSTALFFILPIKTVWKGRAYKT